VTNWQNKDITILGFGRSGISTAKYLVERHANVTLSESSEKTEAKGKEAGELEALGIKVEFGGHSQKAIDEAALIVTSPGVAPSTEVIQRALRAGREVVCDIELAFRETQTPMIAITGTNGKSTTTALISFILEKAGRKAPACGNFGIPILSQMQKPNDFLVVEMSSYQLFYTTDLAPQVAIWLNLTPDHIEWHGSLVEYTKAKQKLFEKQSADQFAILNLDDPVVANFNSQGAVKARLIANSSMSELKEYKNAAFVRDGLLVLRMDGDEGNVCAINELKIIGKHNIENALAAISAAAAVGLSAVETGRYLKEFEALEHRLEFVATINGVSFYNDSKATNTDSAIKALESFPREKVVLIAGGRDKGTSLSEFVLSVRKYASAVILIGEAKERFKKALRDGGVESVYPVDSMEAAVQLGRELKAGPVLLSPACASFDMFKDFEDRGRVFKDIVRTRL
jgi:UDP-N-acetylmuramoylalanine--D-glutamate ligase